MATRILPSPRRPAPAQVLLGVAPLLPLLPFLAMWISCSSGYAWLCDRGVASTTVYINLH
jgi:hypothetical protein